MKKALTTEWQTRLWETIKHIEKNSQIEMVVVLRPRSADYRDIAWVWGVFGAWLGFTYVMFAPEYFIDDIVYATPIAAFLSGFALAHLPLLTRLSIKKTRLEKSVEIMARAIFQKGGIQHTQAKIGVLVYVSWLEKRVVLLADKGVEMALPVSEWQTLRADFQSIFHERKPLDELIAQLEKSQPVFSRYLPPLANDINELPDDLDVDL
jgi:putative membrane protein